MGRKRESEGRRRPTLLVLGGVLFAVVFLLIGWNKAASSPRLCSSCHAMDDATLSAARSVHADVPCLACHTRPGLLGSLRYVPTLAREGLATVTGWDIAGSVLDAAPCTRCHSDLTTSATLKATHSKARTDCTSCHGDVAHPELALVSARPTPGPSGEPHPQGYVQTHGQEAVANPASCSTCHQPEFCQACHFRATFPHPQGWIQKHGKVEETKGASACTLCHPSTFCVGCHGTEIPHQPTWLGEHWRALQDASTSPCLVCHPPRDCTTCHSRHGIHREQDLYGIEVKWP